MTDKIIAPEYIPCDICHQKIRSGQGVWEMESGYIKRSLHTSCRCRELEAELATLKSLDMVLVSRVDLIKETAAIEGIRTYGTELQEVDLSAHYRLKAALEGKMTPDQCQGNPDDDEFGPVLLTEDDKTDLSFLKHGPDMVLVLKKDLQRLGDASGWDCEEDMYNRLKAALEGGMMFNIILPPDSAYKWETREIELPEDLVLIRREDLELLRHYKTTSVLGGPSPREAEAIRNIDAALEK